MFERRCAVELIYFAVGVVFIVGSCQFIKEHTHAVLHGLKGSKLYDNLISERPEKYGDNLTNNEKFWKILFTIVVGLVFTIAGIAWIAAAIYGLHTWLPK